MEKSTFSICFFAKKSKLLSRGLVPLFLRITINGQRWETSLKIGVDKEKWDSRKEKSRGFDKNSNLVNDLINTTRDKIYRIRLRLDQEDKPLTLGYIRYYYSDRERLERTILRLFDSHNSFCEKKVGVQIAQATYDKYLLCRKYLSELLKKEYLCDDLPVRDIDKELFQKFDLYLRTEKDCAKNTAIKYIRIFNKIVIIATEKGWITSSPYKEVGFKYEDIEKPYLTNEELESITKKEFATKSLETVRDIFLFCCYTGLAFSDVKELTDENIHIGIDKQKWIFKSRRKTKVISKIPLFRIAEKIIEDYKDIPSCSIKGTLLPVPSNQKMNTYLKEVADICGIKKTLTTILPDELSQQQYCSLKGCQWKSSRKYLVIGVYL